MSNPQPINQSDVDQIARLIQEHMDKGAPPELGASLGVGDNTKDAFCKNWGTVKPVLTALSGLLAAIPGVGIFAGPAIAVVTTAGDAASRAVCNR